jgi:octaheme c-type cytochrome (tetrathionate reductase family)
MNGKIFRWSAVFLAVITAGLIFFVFWEPQPATANSQNPFDGVPKATTPVDHTPLIEAEIASGRDATAVCLDCHEEAGQQMLHNVHYTWQSEPVDVPGHDEPVAIGKRNLLNNFCIGTQSNEAACSKCHAGYGFTSQNFDFGDPGGVDCLVCHDTTGTYKKGTGGEPLEGVDLVSVAQNVGRPSRANCGSCHFSGGGGNAVKHGDLDTSLLNPSESLDVHMGKLDFQCVDCHQADDHVIKGKSISVSVNNHNAVACTDCHSTDLHEDDRITSHIDTLACQTCHVPESAKKYATKMEWYWGDAGQEREEVLHEYAKKKGTFRYETGFKPEYHWFNGYNERYLLGDLVNPDGITPLNKPLGDIEDPTAKIWPFKVHRGNQVMDAVYGYLLQPQTTTPEGYWTTFDWNTALENGAEVTGIPYSGEYDFAVTEMYWKQSHMISPANDAMQCQDCHGDEGRFDWQALGYTGDPARTGGRFTQDGGK